VVVVQEKPYLEVVVQVVVIQFLVQSHLPVVEVVAVLALLVILLVV
jgi:hypothetical protein